MDAGLRSRITDDTNRLARSFASARICLRSLASNGEATQMPDSAVALDALEPLQVHANFPAKITLDDVLAVLDGMNDLRKLLLGQVLRANARINVGTRQDVFGIAGADTINVPQSDIDAFVGRNFYSDDASHVSTGLMDYWIDG